MKKTLILMMLPVALNVVAAEQFSLRHDASGKVFGPFDTEAGSKVTIGKTSFTVVPTGHASSVPSSAGKPSSSPALEALKTITIPSFVVREASPLDCINLVQRMSRAGGISPSVNIVPRDINKDPFSPGAKRVTLDVREVSAYRVLEEVCQQANLSMQEENGMVVVQPQNR